MDDLLLAVTQPLSYGFMESSDCCPAVVQLVAPRQCLQDQPSLEPSMDALKSELILQPLCGICTPFKTLQGNYHEDHWCDFSQSGGERLRRCKTVPWPVVAQYVMHIEIQI